MSIVAWGYGISGLGGASSIFQQIESVELVDPIEVQVVQVPIEVEVVEPIEVEVQPEIIVEVT